MPVADIGGQRLEGQKIVEEKYSPGFKRRLILGIEASSLRRRLFLGKRGATECSRSSDAEGTASDESKVFAYFLQELRQLNI